MKDEARKEISPRMRGDKGGALFIKHKHPRPA